MAQKRVVQNFGLGGIRPGTLCRLDGLTRVLFAGHRPGVWWFAYFKFLSFAQLIQKPVSTFGIALGPLSVDFNDR
jgi:hypothetical protein